MKLRQIWETSGICKTKQSDIAHFWVQVSTLLKKVSDIPAGDGKIANAFLQCKSYELSDPIPSCQAVA